MSENKDKIREVLFLKIFIRFGFKDSDVFKKFKMIVRSKIVVLLKKEFFKYMIINFVEIKRMKNV